jgi:hypothetical protein
MKNYTAVAAGQNRVKVFDVKTGVTSYHINLESRAEITNVQCPGNSIVVTFKDGCGRIKTNTYNDINRGVLSYSNIVGRYEDPKPVVNKPQVVPSTVPVASVQKQSNAKYYVEQDNDEQCSVGSDFPSFEEWKIQQDFEWRSKPLQERFFLRIGELFDVLVDIAGGVSTYTLFAIVCYVFSKQFPYKGHTFFELLGWLSVLLFISWFLTRGTYKIITYITTKWLTVPLAVYILCYSIKQLYK